MATKILIVESSNFKVPAGTWAGGEIIQVNKIKDSLAAAGNNPVLLIGGLEIKHDPQFAPLLQESPNPFSFLQFSRAEDAVRFAASLAFLASETRSMGVKEALTKGSTICTEIFFGATSLGAKLDPSYGIAASVLPPSAALSAWASLQAMVFLGLQTLPSSSSGEKVDLQVGRDDKKLAMSLQFPIFPQQLAAFRTNPILETLRAAAGFFELRYHKGGSILEIFSVFFAGEKPEWPIECHSIVPVTPLEDSASVREYSFRPLGGAKETGPEAKAASPFKKKFSEKMKASTPVASAPSAGPVVNPAATLAPAPAQPAAPDESAKIHKLEVTVKEKEKRISDLVQELANAKIAPAPADAKAGAKDTLIQTLKENVTRLEDELAEALEREQSSSSKDALQPGIKDQLLRKIKDLEVKLKAATDERSSKILGLEKNLEDQKKKAKDLMKKITELTEQLKEAEAA